MVLTFISLKGRQIVERDRQCGGLDWRPALRNRKNRIYIAAMLIVARLQTVLLDDSLISYRSLVRFRKKYEAQIPQIYFHSARNPVKRHLSVLSIVLR